MPCLLNYPPKIKSPRSISTLKIPLLRSVRTNFQYEGDQIVEELNAQAALASLRIGSRDAHSPQAVWIAGNGHPVLSPVNGYPDVDVYSQAHAIVGTKGFEFITGLDPKNYDFQVYKGIEIDKHPYGALP